MSRRSTDCDRIRRLYVRLSLADGVGPITFRRLLDGFGGDVERVFSAGESALRDVEGVGPKTAAAIRAVDEAEVDREFASARQRDVSILCQADAGYPLALKNIFDPPPVLYVRGRIEPADAIALGIVGSRRCTHYGLEQGERFGGLLGRAGFAIVSGGAWCMVRIRAA